MSSEHPPEEAELGRPVGYICLSCDGWGCSRCVSNPATRARIQTALDELRGKVAALERQLADMTGERDRFAHENTELRSTVGHLKAAVAALTRKLEGRAR